jgi:hypothetical protein
MICPVRSAGATLSEAGAGDACVMESSATAWLNEPAAKASIAQAIKTNFMNSSLLQARTPERD